MKYLICILLPLMLISCKSPQKSVSETRQKADVVIDNDIQLSDDQHLTELTNKIMQRIINDQMNIDIEQTKYDTQKPVDPATGKHPVKEENRININQKTDVNETESTEQKKDSASSFQTKDNSQVKAKTDTKTNEEKEVGLKWYHKAFIAFGIFCFVGVVIFIIIKIK